MYNLRPNITENGRLIRPEVADQALDEPLNVVLRGAHAVFPAPQLADIQTFQNLPQVQANKQNGGHISLELARTFACQTYYTARRSIHIDHKERVTESDFVVLISN